MKTQVKYVKPEELELLEPRKEEPILTKKPRGNYDFPEQEANVERRIGWISDIDMSIGAKFVKEMAEQLIRIGYFPEHFQLDTFKKDILVNSFFGTSRRNYSKKEIEEGKKLQYQYIDNFLTELAEKKIPGSILHTLTAYLASEDHRIARITIKELIYLSQLLLEELHRFPHKYPTVTPEIAERVINRFKNDRENKYLGETVKFKIFNIMF